jgi:hypothetical protein
MLSEENMMTNRTEASRQLCYGLFDEFMRFSWRFSYVDTKKFITALCSTLFENVVFSDEEGFIFKV